MNAFYNKNVVVVGGGCGLGRDMAVEFARNRANIFLIHNNKEELSDTEYHISNMRVKVYSYLCDFKDLNRVKKIADLFLRDYDYADVLVNALEPAQKELFFKYSPNQVVDIITEELISLVYFSNIIYKKMMEKQTGAILNIESTDYNQTDNIVGGICSNGLLALTEGINNFSKQTKKKSIYSTYVYRSYKNYYSTENAGKIFNAFSKGKENIKL